jgi:hypothetical protein
MLLKIKNNRGSGLVWALAVGSFLLFIVTGALTIALHYSQRSAQNNDARQAYLTARSGADLIAQEFINGSDNAASIYSFLETNEAWIIPDVGFQDNLGYCTITVILEEPEDEDTTKRTIQIESSATVNDENRIINATIIGVIQREGIEPQEDGGEDETLTWYLSSYTDGQT